MLGKETTTIRKGHKIHFLSRDEVETITETIKPSSRIEGELTTDKNIYSVDFIQRWRENGFLKIYK